MHNRPCQDRHPTPVPLECHLCLLYETDPKYRALWGGGEVVAAAEVLEHAKRVRPKSGVTVVHTHTALDGTVTTTRTEGYSLTVSGKVTQNRFCIYLGDEVSKTGTSRCTKQYRCDNGYGVVTPCVQSTKILGAGVGCQGCPGYEAEGSAVI